MSASSKKKLRNEQEAAKMTERQLAEQKEAKKLKAYTTAFVVVLAALLVIAVVVGVSQAITTSGVREKNTVAMTVGDTEISNADLSYFYIDTVNNFYSQNGSYASLLGLDVTLPLNEQVMDESTGETWADYFLAAAKDSAHSVYSIADIAKADGYTLSENDTAILESSVSNAAMYALLYGYGDTETYLKAMYGNGATEEGYRNYVEVSLLADSYYTEYAESLTYEDADLRAKEAENFDLYSSFTYNYYYLATSRFLEGGTTSEDGATTYSDGERAASVALAKETAETLAVQEFASVEDFDAAIAALDINADSETAAASTAFEDQAYGSITSVIAEWLADDARKEGDIGCLENATTSTAEDGTETTTVNGYYVVYYRGTNENNFALKNVRHILVSFKGGTTNEDGTVTYSEEEKTAAETAAQEILDQWKAGDATEESFAALATEKSTDTGSTANGGLYENVYPGQMVISFEDWCYDDSRKPGDTGIVESDYGFHVMYFVGDSETTFRDYQIESELVSADASEWYTAQLEAAPVVDGDTSYIKMDLVLSNG